eukprot:15181566-Alexandrium_andersonii.AAC.1
MREFGWRGKADGLEPHCKLRTSLDQSALPSQQLPTSLGWNQPNREGGDWDIEKKAQQAACNERLARGKHISTRIT